VEKLAQYLSSQEAAAYQKELAAGLGAHEIAVVKNLDYVFSPVELYPLAPKIAPPLERIAAFAVDMDGTSTTTEPLALHALEYMVRRFTGRMSREEWSGLDPKLDYPHVIGSSNFRHTEFLVERYRRWLDTSALRQAFVEALVWTLAAVDDPQRRRDVTLNAVNCGLGLMLDDPEFQRAVAEEGEAAAATSLLRKHGARFRCETPAQIVSAALDVYYARYHWILGEVSRGEGARLSRELLGEDGRRLIEPMPAYALFIALVKGWLGDAAGLLAGELGQDTPETREPLARLGRRFEQHPAKLALVTASIAFEAHAVVKEVFRVMREQVSGWPLPDHHKGALLDEFGDYRGVYDGFVTASDSSEARLKPHRDLYSIALYQMSVPKEDYCRCVGLEDTEPGIIALRAAGIGCAVALPNRDTSRQDYRAASLVITGGLPELILERNLLLGP
jgi:beta-phosphoglucomutase-like phosphatase (HAD superfamily)